MKPVFLSWRAISQFPYFFFCFCFVLLGSLVESQAVVKFTVQPQNATVAAGKPAIFNCTAFAGSKKVKYSWSFNGKKIRADPLRVNLGSDGTLSIPSVAKHDAGKYKCFVAVRIRKKNFILNSRVAILIVHSICSTIKLTSIPSQPVYPTGRLIYLKCKCNGIPRVDVQWRRDGTPVAIGGQVTKSGNKLNLDNPTSDDSGSYTCSAANILGTRNSTALALKIIKTADPVFKIKPKDAIVKLGQSAVLKCVATGTPPPAITWHFGTEKHPLTNNSKFSIMYDGTLKIDTTGKGDFGEYKCAARNMMSSIAASAQVRKAYIDEAGFSPNTRYVRKGWLFTHDCRVKGLPTPNIIWKKANGRSLPRRYDVKGGTALRNNKTKMADSGNFTCTASNIDGHSSASIEIIVSEPPEFTVTPKDSQTNENEKVVVKCSAKSSPPSKITWRKDGKEVTRDENHKIDSRGFLTIIKTKSTDHGIYKCTAQHPGGWSVTKTVNVTIYAAVKLETFHQVSHKFDKGTKGKVYCSFQGQKPITIKWRKLGAKLGKKTVPKGDALIIKDVQMSDAGLYTCTGTNNFSSFTAYVNVSVYVYPKFQLKPKNTTAMVSDSVWLHCNATGYPKPKISWGREKHGGDKLNEERFHQYKNGTLHIENLQPDDEGRYYCFAGNLADFKQITISLKVVAHPHMARKSTASMGRTIGIAVGCAAAYIVLVVGLMIYCKGRRARQQKKEQITVPANGDIENEDDGNNEYPLQPINKGAGGTGYNNMDFPRHDLEALRTLGNGSYGRAFLAQASGIKDGERQTMAVVKSLMAKDDIVREDFMREMDALVSMDNTNVVTLLGVCKDIEPLYMIFESFEKGDLKQFLLSCHDNGRSNLTSSHKLTMCSNVVSGMSYLAANKFVHKDLAARNCMVTKDLNVKIGFLGLSYDLYNAEYYRFNNILIPVRWMPSEAIFNDEFTEKSDVWSFGVLAWEIYMLGQTPYCDRSDEEVLKCVKDDLRLSKPDNCPDSVANVMKKCWEANPSDRPTFDVIFSEISEVAVDSHV